MSLDPMLTLYIGLGCLTFNDAATLHVIIIIGEILKCFPPSFFFDGFF